MSRVSIRTDCRRVVSENPVHLGLERAMRSWINRSHSLNAVFFPGPQDSYRSVEGPGLLPLHPHALAKQIHSRSLRPPSSLSPVPSPTPVPSSTPVLSVNDDDNHQPCLPNDVETGADLRCGILPNNKAATVATVNVTTMATTALATAATTATTANPNLPTSTTTPLGHRDQMKTIQRQMQRVRLRRTAPRQYPLENRDKCGACTEYHDIRYCPYPNTEDGRTKICPICDTSKHAWFECWYYKRDVMEQWTVCWVNRRCLPTLVHDAPLDEIFYSRVSLARQAPNIDVPSHLESLNSLPGPLSPAFVQKLVPPDREDAWIQHELQEGRVVPWELSRAALEDGGHRAQGGIRDESTTHMLIDGTRSSIEDIPATIKHESFIMSDAMKANNEVYDRILAQKPLPTVKAVIPPPGRDFPNRRVGGGTCDNCGSSSHPRHHCLGPCKECGMSAPNHFGSLGYWCSRGCVCGPNPGHTRTACNSLCRSCTYDGDLNTELKDCKKHCPLHMCLTSDGRDHSWCAAEHKACPSCKERHWRQDCPTWLSEICVRQDCLELKCKTHCALCGGLNIDGIMSFFPKNDNVAYKQKVEGLVRTWHRYLHNCQWQRESDTYQIFSSWNVLRCPRHNMSPADAHALEEARASTWKKVVNCVRGGFTKETVAEAERLLKIPECKECLIEQKSAAGKCNMRLRAPGDHAVC